MGTKRAERPKPCTKFITEPNSFVAQIHGRMRVILDVKDFQQWEQGDVKDAAALMTPAPEDLLVKRAMSLRVNRSERMTMTPRSLTGWGR
jgi:putative SOS response-associated peptidase YedK